MRPPCEIIVSYVLPAIRAMVVDELKTTHKLKQVDMAKRLKVSQSAISQYNTQARGAIYNIEKYKPEFDDEIKDIANMIDKNESEKKLIGKLCSVCRSLQNKHFKEILCDIKGDSDS